MTDHDSTSAARVFSDPETRVVLHLGAHCTGGERLIFSLKRDKALLEKRRVGVLRQQFFTDTLRDFTTERLCGRPADIAEQEELFEKLIGTSLVDRLVLSYDSFLAAPDRAVAAGGLYVAADQKARELRNLFPDNRVEFLLAIRNPATFLPALFSRVDQIDDIETFIHALDTFGLRWSNVITQIQQGAPDVPIAVWCNEDTPLVWGRVLRHALGIDTPEMLDGQFDVAKEIMTDAGREAFETYVEAKPPRTDAQAARLVELFLDRFAAPDALVETETLPGHSDEDLAALTRLYEEDVARIAGMPGVTLLTP